MFCQHLYSTLGIDCELYSVNQAEDCEKHATSPIKYVVAFDNGKQNYIERESKNFTLRKVVLVHL